MGKPIPTKRRKIPRKASARKGEDLFPKNTTGICGVDISMSGIAVAGIAYDSTLRRIIGPDFLSWRWEPNTHYFDRLHDLARPENFILELFKDMRVLISRENTFIAVEEPWPLGMVKQMESNSLKQNAEIQGALLGGLVRYGFRNIFQIPANHWRQIVAAELGITIHYSKWRDPKLCEIYNCVLKDSGKFRAKQWALKYFPEIPDWPDMIKSKKGKVPRPEGSKAKSFQCDDRYDALAIMEWMHREWRAMDWHDADWRHSGLENTEVS